LISSGIYLAHIRVTEDIIDESSSNILISENDYIVKKFIVIR